LRAQNRRNAVDDGERLRLRLALVAEDFSFCKSAVDQQPGDVVELSLGAALEELDPPQQRGHVDGVTRFHCSIPLSDERCGH
jgi:hypothetical protein